jgi:hypothetical protein
LPLPRIPVMCEGTHRDLVTESPINHGLSGVLTVIPLKGIRVLLPGQIVPLVDVLDSVWGVSDDSTDRTRFKSLQVLQTVSIVNLEDTPSLSLVTQGCP